MTNSTHAVCQIWQDYKMARQEAKLGQIRAHSDKWWPLNHQRTRLCFTWWRQSGGNSFTAMEILRLFALWQNVILQTWFMSQIRWRNAKFFQSPPLRKFPKAHIHLPSIQLDRTMTIWNTPRVREASWLLRDLQLWASEEADYNPFPGRILLQTRPTLCAYDTFHYITTYSIVRIMIFVHICWSPFFVEKANVSILPAFKK